MNERLVAWLRCPDCRGRLSLQPFAYTAKGAGAEIAEGALRCACGGWFPIIGGVPRLLPRALWDRLPKTYPAFFKRYAGDRGRSSAPVVNGSGPADPATQARIMESFGFEWNTFSGYDSPNFERWIAPLVPEAFRGKLVLDAGCGAGRHAIRAASYGAEVVAMDLSPAVDAAYRNARGVHVVQGDIFHPPLAGGIFDIVYSLGVLHHTPDPPSAFRSLVPLLAPDGTMAVMLYAAGRPIALGVLAAVRALTTRLPLRVVQALSWLAAVVDTAGPIALARGLAALGVSPAALARLLPEHPRLYARETFATCYTDWLDRLSYPHVHYYRRQDVIRWFAGAGLEATAVTALGTYGWVGIGSAGRAAAAVGAGR